MQLDLNPPTVPEAIAWMNQAFADMNACSVAGSMSVIPHYKKLPYQLILFGAHKIKKFQDPPEPEPAIESPDEEIEEVQEEKNDQQDKPSVNVSVPEHLLFFEISELQHQIQQNQQEIEYHKQKNVKLKCQLFKIKCVLQQTIKEFLIQGQSRKIIELIAMDEMWDECPNLSRFYFDFTNYTTNSINDIIKLDCTLLTNFKAANDVGYAQQLKLYEEYLAHKKSALKRKPAAYDVDDDVGIVGEEEKQTVDMIDLTHSVSPPRCEGANDGGSPLIMQPQRFVNDNDDDGHDASFDWRNADVLSQKYLPPNEQEQFIDADPMDLDLNDAAVLNQFIEGNAAIAKQEQEQAMQQLIDELLEDEPN